MSAKEKTVKTNEMKPNEPEYQKALHALFGSFLKGDEADCSIVRPMILESWKRSRAAGVNPDAVVDSAMPEDQIRPWFQRNAAFIEVARPYMEKVYSLVQGSGFYIQLSDQDGFLLHNIGDEDIMQFGNRMTNVYTGAEISEKSVGTSGIGTCVAIQEPVQIWGEEHYYTPHKNFVCSAAPIFNEYGGLIGTFSVSGKPENVNPHTLAMVCSSADAIQKELRMKKYYESIQSISNQRNFILQAMDTGLILLNQDQRIIHINDAAVQMLNFYSLSLIDKNLLDFLSFSRTQEEKNDLQLISKPGVYDEITVYRKAAPEAPKRFQMRVKSLQDSTSEESFTLISLVESKAINKLFKNLSGYSSRYTFDSILGNSPALIAAKKEATRIASTSLNVLILGPNGTGKELFAHAIHSSSAYASGPFIAVNCASLPRELVASELFGYERGAFTGADKNGSPGKFELADKGTIFLDEIGDMPLDIQASVLRVIEDREIVRIGGHNPKQIDIRIIAATNKDLRKAVMEHSFREDLYYRLAVSVLHVPSLSERTGDVRILADQFLSKSDHGRHLRISEETYALLEQYPWPGNVRQLLNAIERAISITDSDVIEPRHLPTELLQNQPADFSSAPQSATSMAFTPEIITFEQSTSGDPVPGQPMVKHHKKPSREQLIALLTNCQGSITLACEQIGMSRSTLYRHLKKHGIDYTAYRI